MKNKPWLYKTKRIKIFFNYKKEIKKAKKRHKCRNYEYFLDGKIWCYVCKKECAIRINDEPGNLAKHVFYMHYCEAEDFIYRHRNDLILKYGKNKKQKVKFNPIALIRLDRLD
jgi:hypothetical protein